MAILPFICPYACKVELVSKSFKFSVKRIEKRSGGLCRLKNCLQFATLLVPSARMRSERGNGAAFLYLKMVPSRSKRRHIGKDRKLHGSVDFSFFPPAFLSAFLSLERLNLSVRWSSAVLCCQSQLGCSCPLSDSAFGFEEVLNLSVTQCSNL